MRADIDLTDRDELENFVMAYTFFAGVFEGTWFYNGFSPIFALQRRGLMKGTAQNSCNTSCVTKCCMPLLVFACASRSS